MDPCFQGFKNIYKIYISQTCDTAKLANFSKTSANLVELTLVEKQKIPKKS
jgi:hypothetical protein